VTSFQESLVQTNLFKTRTFWVGVTAIFAAVVAAVFGQNETIDHVNVMEALKTFVADPKTYVGFASIFGRAAIVNVLKGLLNPPSES
jgi:hypothetical protein